MTVPPSVAEVAVMLYADIVVPVGGKHSVVNVSLDPLLVPLELVATSWNSYVVLEENLSISGSSTSMGDVPLPRFDVGPFVHVLVPCTLH